MSRLEIRCLGTPEIRHGGRPVRPASRKAVALLVYLVVEGGLQSRESLIALLWPESDPARGRAVLRRTLAYLRASLDAGTTSGAADHLRAPGDHLGFDAETPHTCDVLTLDATWALARGRTTDPRALEAALHAALAGARGEFLAGFTLPDAPGFDDWAAARRETCHTRLRLLYERLAQLQFEAGATGDALETATRWVTHDPLDEAAHRRLMQIHFARGDRAAALQAYAACRAILARELHAEPVPETTELAARIRVAPPPTADPTEAPPAERATVPLVGRGPEHAALVEAYRAARRGHPQAVVIEGESGIGKTRLARDFGGWALAQGARVLVGGAVEAGGHLPYQPLVDALGLAISAPAPAGLLPAAWLAELSRLFPDLRARLPALPAPLPLAEAEARGRLFEALARLAEALAAAQPLVLFVDDAQWADPATRDWLLYAAHRWADGSPPILLIVALRSEDLAGDADLAAWVARLARYLPGPHPALAPLDAAASAQLVGALVAASGAGGAVAPEALGTRLYAETRGHPFFLVETVKALAADRAPDAGHLPLLPATVRDLITERLARLSPDARALVRAGAVLGPRFTFEQVRGVAGLAEAAALAALDEARARRVLREAGAQVGFLHDQIRTVAYGMLGPARARALHGRALALLATGGVPAAELARHAVAAAHAPAVFTYSRAAGTAALALFAVRDAITHFERAQHALSGPGAPAQPPAGAVLALYRDLGRAYELAADLPAARASYTALRARAQAARDAPQQVAALTQLALLAAQESMDLTAAEALLAEARAVADAHGDAAGLALVEWNLAQLDVYRGQPGPTPDHALRALALARAHDQPALAARSLNAAAYASFFLGDWAAVATYAGEARAAFATFGDRIMERDSLSLRGYALIHLGDTPGAVAAGREAVALARDLDNAWAIAAAACFLAIALTETGDYEVALAIAGEGLALAETHSLVQVRVLSALSAGLVHRALLDPAAALAADTQAAAFHEAVRMPTAFAELVAGALCADHALAGDWPAAAVAAHRALALRDPTRLVSPWTRPLETAALLHAGAVDAARGDLTALGARAPLAPRFHLAWQQAAAVFAEATGDPAGATDHLEAARNVAATLGLPGAALEIAGDLARLYGAAGQAAAATAAANMARAEIDGLAAGIADPARRAAFTAAARARLPAASAAPGPDFAGPTSTPRRTG